MTREALHLKYRPLTFGDVAGQRPPVAVLYRMCARRAVPNGLLLAGEHGTGKTTLARITAKALNCAAPPGPPSRWPCNACPSCKMINDHNHPHVEEIDAASNGTVDQIRSVRERAFYGAYGDGYRVFIIDEAHGLSGPAFEAMLMILEAPPPGVLFTLCTTRPGAVPDTVGSRLSPFWFQALPAAVIRKRLEHVCQAEGITAEPELLTAIAEKSGGAMRDALVQLDQLAAVGIGSLPMWRELTGETDFAPGLLAAAAAGDYEAMYAAMEDALAAYSDPGHVGRQLTACLKDLLRLSCNGRVTAQGAALEARRELAGQLGAARVSAAMAALWELQTRIRSEDREQGLELALNVIARRLAPPPAAGQAAPLNEIRALMGSPIARP